MAKKAVTIRDVARHAGVSVATASRVLTGNQVVNADTRARPGRDGGPRVHAEQRGAAAEPRADPHDQRRQSFLTRPQAAERLRGVDAVLGDSEFDLVIYNVETIEKRDQYLRGLAVRPADRWAAGHLAAARARGRSAAVVGRRSRSSSSTPTRRRSRACPTSSVTTSPAALAATRHLLELGTPTDRVRGRRVRRPVRVHVEPPPLRRLRAGARERPASRSRPDLVALGAHSRYEARELAARLLLARPIGRRAIFAASDTQALGVISAAHEVGLHVPDDLSVVGYDDIEVADYVGLTTVRQQLFESGRRGAELLLRGDRGALRATPPVVELAPRARGPRDHGATEGGTWMTEPDPMASRRRSRSRRRFMIGIRLRWHRRLRHAATPPRPLRCPRRGCAAPGTESIASGGVSAGPRRAAARTSAAVRQAAAAARLRDGSGRPERVLRDRLRSAVQALRRVHQAVPERHLGHQPGPVHEPHDRHAAAALG